MTTSIGLIEPLSPGTLSVSPGGGVPRTDALYELVPDALKQMRHDGVRVEIEMPSGHRLNNQQIREWFRTAGFSEAQAEALADANRDMLVPDLATKGDLKAEIAGLEQRFTAALEAAGLRLTIHTGVMLAAGLSLMTAIIGAMLRFH